MLKKVLYLLIAVAVIILAACFLQPGKTGVGYNTTVTYQIAEKWPDLPADFELGNPTGLGMDTSGNLLVFCRRGRKWPFWGNMPDKPIPVNTILKIDRFTGKLINSWGDSLFIMPHGLTVDKHNNIWVTDVALHQVFKFSAEGTLLLSLGEAKIAGTDSLHFDKPTDIAVADDGSFYVSDGYGNSRILKFSASGHYLFEWGKKGNKEGEFTIPHGITLDPYGNVYVADRENERIQIFDSTGKFIRQIADKTFGAVCAVAFSDSKLLAVDDHSFLKIKHKGSDIFVFDSTGKAETRFGRSGSYNGHRCWYHDLAVDKDRNIYVGDILGNTIQKFKLVSLPH